MAVEKLMELLEQFRGRGCTHGNGLDALSANSGYSSHRKLFGCALYMNSVASDLISDELGHKQFRGVR